MGHKAQVIIAGKIALDLLCTPSTGIVHAVFQRTFYLRKTGTLTPAPPITTGNNARQSFTGQPSARAVSQPALLCCIGQAELERGPLNVRTTLNDITHVTVGDEWSCDQQLVSIGNIELDLSRAKIWLPTPLQQSAVPDPQSVALLARFLEINTPQPQVQHRINEMINEQLINAVKQLQQWLDHYQNQGGQPAIHFPDHLLGCGDGLTPAGDDIVVGVLLAMRAWKMPALDLLVAEVTDRLDTTSDISAAHLIAACSGSGIAPLHQLIDCVGTRDGNQLEYKFNNSRHSRKHEQIQSAATALCSYGHSSGYHAMQGVLLAARHQQLWPL